MPKVKASARDRLTGLRGRTRFDTVFSEMVSRAVADTGAVSIGVLDIDLFGRINGEYGRSAGDAVLQCLAEALNTYFQDSAQVFRFGGDAFAVFWPDLEKEQALLVFEAFRKEFSGRHVITVDAVSLELPLTLSAGLAAYPDDGAEAVDLVNKANEALYRAKVTGRDKVCLAREEKMVTKTSHYTQGQLLGLRRLSEREGFGEAVLLREALNDLLRKYNA